MKSNGVLLWMNFTYEVCISMDVVYLVTCHPDHSTHDKILARNLVVLNFFLSAKIRTNNRFLKYEQLPVMYTKSDQLYWTLICNLLIVILKRCISEKIYSRYVDSKF